MIDDYEALVKLLLHVQKWRGKYIIATGIVSGYDISKKLTPEFREKLISLLLR